MASEGVILVVASAGGHLDEALCATSLIEEPMVLVCNRNMLRKSRFQRIHLVRDSQFNPVVHAWNVVRACVVVSRERPRAIFSTGGPICLSFALVAKLLRIRFVYLDTMARVSSVSNTGRLISRLGLYDEFLCQWQQVAASGAHMQYCGQVFNMADEPSGKNAEAAKNVVQTKFAANDSGDDSEACDDFPRAA